MTATQPTNKRLSIGQIIFVVFVGLLIIGLFTGGGSKSKASDSWCTTHSTMSYRGKADNPDMIRYIDDCLKK